MRREQAIPHASNSQKDPRNLHYICKMRPLVSTAPKKPSKLLTRGAGRRISSTGTAKYHIKNMEMNGQSEGSASSSQFPVTFFIPVTKISDKYHRKRGIILTHSFRKWRPSSQQGTVKAVPYILMGTCGMVCDHKESWTSLQRLYPPVTHLHQASQPLGAAPPTGNLGF